MSNKVLNPSAVCTKTVRDNQGDIFCNSCKHWLHVSCISLSVSNYNALSCVDDDWYCQKCLIDIFPVKCIEDEIESVLRMR